MFNATLYQSLRIRIENQAGDPEFESCRPATPSHIVTKLLGRPVILFPANSQHP
jgi:hypothetical protein